MKIKLGVTIAGLDLRMRPVLIAAEKIWKDFGQELVITSGLDGEHSAGSLHYYGLAVDLRTRYFLGEDKMKVTKLLRKALGSGYVVLAESTHIHVGYSAY